MFQQTKQNALQVKVNYKLIVTLGLGTSFKSYVWFNQEGDLEAGLKAASAIGDDTLQKNHKGYVVPDSFLMELQIKEWSFKKGFL